MSQLIFRTAFLKRLSFRETLEPLTVVAGPFSPLGSLQRTVIVCEVVSRLVVANRHLVRLRFVPFHG